MSEWTPEKEAELTELLAEGLSRTAIGDRLGFSRNAISGKISRMKALKGEGGAKPGAKSARPPKQVTTASDLIAEMDAADLPLKFALRKIEWSRSKCSWPTGDPQSTEFNFCGKEVVQGKPYCNDHCFEAYTTTRESEQPPQQAQANASSQNGAADSDAPASGEAAGDDSATATATREK